MKTLRSLVPVVVATLAGCAAPVVETFDATPASIEIGDSATLRWRVIDATSVSISGIGNVPLASTYLTVTPSATTTYELTAKNSGGTTSKQVTVTVIPRLDAAAGTFLDRGAAGTTFAFVLRTLGGAPPASSTGVTVTGPGAGSAVFACPAGQQVCLFERPSDAPVDGTYTATAVVDGQTRVETFTLDGAARGFSAGPLFAAQETASTVAASWGAAPGAASYRVQLVDSSGAAKGPAQIVTGTSATVSASSPILATDRIQVDASALDLTGATVALPLAKPNIARETAALGGSATAWRLFAPAAYSGNVLTASFANLTAAERLAVIVVNADGADTTLTESNVTLGVSGTLALPVPPSRPAWSPPWRLEGSPRALALRGEEEIRAEEEARMEATRLERLFGAKPSAPARTAVAPPPAPATRDFCVQDRDTGRFLRVTATLRNPAAGEAAHVLFYVDDADGGQYTTADFDRLAQQWEGNPPGTGIYAKNTSAFGPESDVDANGKLIVFFSHHLGQGSPSTGVVLGYFYAFDTMMAQDTTANCSGNASNAADMFYLNTISNIQAAIPTADVLGTTYPSTLAHEFQHLINVNAHCVLLTCSALEDRWLNEGLSMAAEDVNGFGWTSDPIYGRMYLDRSPVAFPLSYNGRSLTTWEDDPIGNYEASHSLVLFWMDRYGVPVLRHLVEGDLTGIDRTQAVLGAPWARQLAEWTSALMFSNETFNPAPDLAYTGLDRTPLHTKITYVNYVPLNPSGAAGAVRRDGWNAFATGAGTGSTATVQVTSADPVKPHVVMVRFSGALPQCPTGAPQADGSCHYQ